MKILVIGNGGREDALCYKLAQSPKAGQIFCAPGNGGTAARGVVNVDLDPLDTAAVCTFAAANDIGLTVIGPEAPLAAGLADALTKAGLRVFGPTAKAAQIEASKETAKQIMQKYGIPTAAYAAFSDADAAKDYVKKGGYPAVIKADGLAAGKGVIIVQDENEAFKAIDDMLSGNAFGAAGHRVVIEEFLRGEEVSILAFCDGEAVLPMVSAQDHKRAFDGDQGPNTGGMGAYSPAPVYTDELARQVEATILRPMARALVSEGRYYRGVLYAGLMITPDGPKVVEFNARFGDPETQAVLMRLQSDLVEVMEAVLDGTLNKMELNWLSDASVCVVMASGGYPGAYAKGKPINGIKEATQLGAQVFQAGTTVKDNVLLTAGGRVLGVTALGADIQTAVQNAYKAVEKISFDGCQYRRDIAYRAINRS